MTWLSGCVRVCGLNLSWHLPQCLLFTSRAVLRDKGELDKARSIYRGRTDIHLLERVHQGCFLWLIVLAYFKEFYMEPFPKVFVPSINIKKNLIACVIKNAQTKMLNNIKLTFISMGKFNHLLLGCLIFSPKAFCQSSQTEWVFKYMLLYS